VWVLKFVAAMSYGAAAILMLGATLIFAHWQLTWPVVRNCAGAVVIAAAFVFAGVRNQREARKREEETVNLPDPAHRMPATTEEPLADSHPWLCAGIFAAVVFFEESAVSWNNGS
jgi:hypothetical protein